MPGVVIAILVVLLLLGLLFAFGAKGLLYNCAPNEVLIFAGLKRRENGRVYGFRLIKGGSGFKIPLYESVYRIDLTNIVIDVQVTNAYSKGGIPLTVQGVANVKIAGHEPLLNNAIERFLGKSRQEIMQVAKATLEGSLRGILATMTPEQVNEDKLLFAERLVSEVEQDMTALGLVVDTMKIQNVQDDVKYLESLGRKRNAEVLAKARIAEAVAEADSIVRSAENQEREVQAQIAAKVEVAKADAQRRLTDALTRRAAVVAEEQSQVLALVAQSKAELEVQRARVEQVRRRLEADVVTPAKASAEAADASAKAVTASIVEEGNARADALRTIAQTWRQAGPNAKEVLVAQKLDSIAEAIVGVIPETHVQKITMIDGAQGGGGFGKTLGTLEQIKQVFGIDVVQRLNDLTTSKEPALPAASTVVRPTSVAESTVEPAPIPAPPPVRKAKVEIPKFEA